jgi:hypothetical protein
VGQRRVAESLFNEYREAVMPPPAVASSQL